MQTFRATVVSTHILSSGNMAPSVNESNDKNLVITIIGGGNSGHVCASLIHENFGGKVKVQLYTSRPEVWSNSPVVTFPGGGTQKGLISLISSDPSEVLPQSDIVLWTGPVNATRGVFEDIRSYIDPKKTVVGTIFAQGLVHLLAYRIFGPEMKFFALRNIPWLCRLVTVGSRCEVIGVKSSIEAALVNLTPEWVHDVLERMFLVGASPRISLLPDFVPIVFNPANQLIHPAVYYSCFRKWKKGGVLCGKDEPSEWLYRGMGELAGNILETLDEEMQAIKNAYYESTRAESCLSVLSLRERLLIQYGDQIKDTSTMAKLVGTNSAYSLAKTPMIRTELGVAPNPKHRVVVDDIGWGLCVLVSIADRLAVPCYMMKMMISWHQDLMEKEYLVNGIIAGRDSHELVLIARSDPLELVGKIPNKSNHKDSITQADSEENRIGNP